MALHPDVRKYYVFRALIKRFALPVLVLFSLDRGLSIAEIGFIAVAGDIASLVLEVPSGSIADAIGHRRALVLSMLGQAVAMGLFLGGSFWWILCGTVMYFGMGTLMTGTSEALFYERLQTLGLEKDHLRLYGQGKGFATAVSVVSMALAGVTYELAWYLPFLICVAQFLVAAAVIGTFGPVNKPTSVSHRERYLAFLRNFRTASRAIIENKRLFWMILSSGLVIGVLFGIGDFQQAIMSDIGMTAALIGFVYAAKRVAGVLIQGYTHKLTALCSAPVFTLICALLAIVHYLLVGITTNYLFLAIVLVAGSMSWVGLEVATNHYMNALITTGARATTLSASNMLRDLIQILAVCVYTAVATLSGNVRAYNAMGLLLILTISVPIVMLFRAYRET